MCLYFQVGGSFLFIMAYYWRRITGAAFGQASMNRDAAANSESKILDTSDEEDDLNSDFEVAIQPGAPRYITTHRQYSEDADETYSGSGSYTPTSAASSELPVRRRNGASPRYVD